MSAKPLWRGPAGVLPSLLDLKGATQAFGVGVLDLVEVWPVGDRTPVTREQIEQASGALSFLFHTQPLPGDDNRRKAYQDVRDLLALLSGAEEDATDGG